MVADKKKVSTLVKTAKGQLEGVLKMIEEDKYCIDISNQLMAAAAIIKKANAEVLSAHMQGCVKNAIETGDSDEKIKELTDIINKLTK